MNSWIYLFSKFTSEALLFEALFFFLVIGFFSAFWLLRRRRLGDVDSLIPAGVVKNYLNNMIGDAQKIQADLLGVAPEPTVSAHFQAQTPLSVQVAAAPVQGAPGINIDAALAAKLAELEAKLLEQAKAMDAMKLEKQKLEQDLTQAKASGGATAGGGGGNSAETDELKKKLEALQAKLDEYSVIEDDLANLKRLQQENAQLKAQVGSGATAAPAASAPAAAAPAPQVELPKVETPAPAAPAAAAPTATTEVPAFENMVNQLEQSMATPAPTAAPATAAAAPATGSPSDSTTPAQPATVNKSDADLLAEFEKMLGN